MASSDIASVASSDDVLWDEDGGGSDGEGEPAGMTRKQHPQEPDRSSNRSKQVYCAKILVLGSMLFAAAFIVALTFASLQREEDSDFKDMVRLEKVRTRRLDKCLALPTGVC